uniref:Uncharacterized protein n=1 Tax=Setaria italica TaxID=4555 RepID=K4A442_SETIT
MEAREVGPMSSPVSSAFMKGSPGPSSHLFCPPTQSTISQRDRDGDTDTDGWSSLNAARIFESRKRKQ